MPFDLDAFHNAARTALKDRDIAMPKQPPVQRGFDLDAFFKAAKDAGYSVPETKTERRLGVDINAFEAAAKSVFEQQPEVTKIVTSYAGKPEFRTDTADSLSEFASRWTPGQAYMAKWHDPHSAWWMKALVGTIGAPATFVQSGIAAYFDRPQTESISDMLEGARQAGEFEVTPAAKSAMHLNPLNLVFDPVTMGDTDKSLWRRIPESLGPFAAFSTIKRMAQGWTPEDEEKYIQGATGAVGFAADIAADPLTYVSFGAGPAFVKAAQALKAAPVTGAVVNAERALKGAESLRMAPRLTQETVPLAARLTVQQSIEQALPRMGDVAPEVQATMRETLQGAYGEGADAFERMLTGARERVKGMKGATPGQTPASVFDAKVPLPKRLEELAEHQALLERDIWAQRPATRAFGIPLMPSPFDAAGRATERLFGGWKVAETLAKPVTELGLGNTPPPTAHDYVAAQIGQKGSAWEKATLGAAPEATMQDRLVGAVQRTFEPVVNVASPNPITLKPEQVSAGDLFRLTEAAQVGHAGRFGVITAPGELKTFLQKDLQGFAKANRARAFDDWRTLYETKLEVLKRNPGAVTNTTRKQLEDAVKTFEHLRTDKKFWQDLGVDAQGVRSAEQLFADWHKAVNEVNTYLADVRQTTATALAKGDATGLVDAVDMLWTRLADLPEPEMQRVISAFDTMNHAAVPMKTARAWRQTIADVAGTAQKTAEDSLNLHQEIEQALRAAPDMEGMEIVAKALNETPDLMRLVVSELTDPLTGLPRSPSSLPASNAAQAVGYMQADVDKLLKAGRLNQQQHAAVSGFLASIGKSPEAVGRTVEIVRNVKNASKYHGIRAATMNALTEPLANFMGKVNVIQQKARRGDVRTLTATWGDAQARWEPNKLGKMLRGFSNGVDRIKQAVLRDADVDPRIVDVVATHDMAPASASRAAVKSTRDFFRTDVAPVVARLRPSKEMTRPELAEILEGYVDVVENLPGVTASFASPDKTKAVQALATQKVADGYKKLERVFGSRQLADQAIAAIKPAVAKRTTELYKRELQAGFPINYRENYLPRFLVGSKRDQERFYRFLEGEAMQTANAEQKAKITDLFFGPAQMRTIGTMAELEYELARVKKALAERGESLNLTVPRDLAALLTHRVYLSERAIQARKIVADLQEVLPAHVMPVQYVGGKPVPPGADFEDLGKLYAGMSGYLVRRPLFEYLARNSPQSESSLETLSGLFGWLTDFNRRLTKLSTTWDLSHLRNIAGLTYISGLSPAEWGATAKGMVRRAVDSNKTLARWDRSASPVQALAEGLEGDELFELALENGLFPFRSFDVAVSPHEQIDAWLRPLNTNPLSAAWRHLKQGSGPFDAIQFEVADASARLSLFKKFLDAGLSPRQAAESANAWLIDYSMRWASPELRRLVFATMPFPGWRIGNALLHVPNVVLDPRRYALADHVTLALSEGNTGIDPMEAQYPHFLTSAIATNMTKPGTNLPQYVHPDFPWRPWRKFMSDVAADPVARVTQPATGPIMAAEFIANRLYDLPFGMFLDMTNPAGRARMEQATWPEILLGGERDEGMMRTALWGLMPYWRLVSAAADPEQRPFMPDHLRRFGTDLFVRTSTPEPGPKGLRVNPKE